MTLPRRPRLVVLAVVAVLAPALWVTPANAAKTKVDKARESAKAIRAELNRVTEQLERQEARSASARQAAVAARALLARARADEAAVEHRLAEMRHSVKSVALQMYMAGEADRVGLDPIAAARAEFLRYSAIGVQRDVVDALAATRQDLQIKRRSAEVAARVADDRQRAAGRAVASLRSSQAEQLRLVSAAEQRYLASLKEAELAARSRRVRGSSISLTTVRGITVHTSIADNLERLLSAADADGMRFGGSGYRSPSGQVAARRRNCGSSEYDIYEKPSSRCRPPTAKPGQSMHEQGLAIDFTYNGSVINSRSNAGFRWLKANAGRYGLYNLPSEPWHWSTNGN